MKLTGPCRGRHSRQLPTVVARWTFTFWILSNYFQACAGTGNGANIAEACGVVEYLLAQPKPASVPGAPDAAAKLGELAQRCIAVDNHELWISEAAAGISTRPSS
ncbi:MAG: hypothetical protein H0T46_34135 [Deltaproteobacteria bacterium]|nr:hypothetical protein [Deltaproteobacteria bacterium]